MTKAALAESQSSVSQSVISHSPSTSSREQGQQSAPAPEQPAPAPTCVPATPVMSTWRSAACFGAAHSAHEDQRQAVAYHTRTGVQQPAPWICLLTAARPCRPSVHLPRLAYARRLSSVGRHRRTVVSASPLPGSARRQPMALGGHCSQTSTRLTSSSSSPAKPSQAKPNQTKHNQTQHAQAHFSPSNWGPCHRCPSPSRGRLCLSTADGRCKSSKRGCGLVQDTKQAHPADIGLDSVSLHFSLAFSLRPSLSLSLSRSLALSPCQARTVRSRHDLVCHHRTAHKQHSSAWVLLDLLKHAAQMQAEPTARAAVRAGATTMKIFGLNKHGSTGFPHPSRAYACKSETTAAEMSARPCADTACQRHTTEVEV